MKNKKIILHIVLLFMANLSFAATRYVKNTSNGSADGSSWGNASHDLQHIINISNFGDIIWVTKGRYTPNRPYNQLHTTDIGNRENSFILKDGVKIYGSFRGDEDLGFDLSNRDFINNQTILSGDFNEDDVYDFENASILGNAENANHILRNMGNGFFFMDGFTVSGGNGEYGGGIYLSGTGSTILNNCKFTGNQAGGLGGGAIWASQSDLIFTNCSFTGNNSHFGAGIYILSAKADIINCTFSYNVSTRSINNQGTAFGASIFAQSSPKLQIVNCSFDNNIADYGAGVYCSQSKAIFKNSVFQFNTATEMGGAIRSEGGEEVFSGCRFIRNTAKTGGAIGATNPNQTFISSLFVGNSASKEGGAIMNAFQDNWYLEKITQQFTNCSFYLNDAVESGKAIYGTGIGRNLNNVIIDNTVELNNSIIWQNNNSYAGTEILTGIGTKYTLNNSILQGQNSPQLILNPVSQYLLNLNPRISNSDFSIYDDSPAINRGNNSYYVDAGGDLLLDLDLRNNHRLHDTNIDIGAFENQTSVLPISLLSFTAKNQKDVVNLYWKTANEINNKRFKIYRGTTDKEFIKIGVRNGGSKNYNYIDKKPINGNNYYKLIQIDNDGKPTELGIRHLYFSLSTLSLYPNPASQYLNINVVQPGKIFEVYNAQGKLIMQQLLNQTQNTIIISNLHKGLYFYRYGNELGKFIKE